MEALLLAAEAVDDPRRRRWEVTVVATLAIAYALTVSTSRNALFTGALPRRSLRSVSAWPLAAAGACCCAARPCC